MLHRNKSFREQQVILHRVCASFYTASDRMCGCPIGWRHAVCCQVRDSVLSWSAAIGCEAK